MTGGRDVALFIGRNKMRELWNMVQAVFTGIGGWLGYFLGGCDGLLYALIAFLYGYRLHKRRYVRDS